MDYTKPRPQRTVVWGEGVEGKPWSCPKSRTPFWFRWIVAQTLLRSFSPRPPRFCPGLRKAEKNRSSGVGALLEVGVSAQCSDRISGNAWWRRKACAESTRDWLGAPLSLRRCAGSGAHKDLRHVARLKDGASPVSTWGCSGLSHHPFPRRLQSPTESRRPSFRPRSDALVPSSVLVSGSRALVTSSKALVSTSFLATTSKAPVTSSEALVPSRRCPHESQRESASPVDEAIDPDHHIQCLKLKWRSGVVKWTWQQYMMWVCLLLKMETLWPNAILSILRLPSIYLLDRGQSGHALGPIFGRIQSWVGGLASHSLFSTYI